MQYGNNMKKIAIVLLISAIYISSCSSGRIAAKDYDDVYYSDRDAGSGNNATPEISNNTPTASQDYSGAKQNESQRNYDQNNNSGSNDQNSQSGNQSNTTNSDQTPERFQNNGNSSDNTSTQSSTDQDGNTYVTNNYYNNDDYYDYAYTSRVRRFYHPYGWNYYDSYYTNMYWYDYDPYSYGVSLYLSYNFWRPQYVWTPAWGASIGFGNSYYGSSGYYGNGYYGNGYGYNNSYNYGYANGYNNGYYAGLYNGTFNPYYYNSNDSYSYYYGPRGGRGALANNAPRGGRNLSELYGRQQISDNPRNPKLTSGIDGVSAIGRPKREIGSINANSIASPVNGNTGIVKDNNVNHNNTFSSPGNNNPSHPNSVNGVGGHGNNNPTKENTIKSNLSSPNDIETSPTNHHVINPRDYTGKTDENSSPSNSETSPHNVTPKGNTSPAHNPRQQYSNPRENTSPAQNPKEQYSNPNENSSPAHNPREQYSNPRENSTPASNPRDTKQQSTGRPRGFLQHHNENSAPVKDQPTRQNSSSDYQNNSQQRNYESQPRSTNPNSGGGSRPSSAPEGRQRNR